jgi:hypothetical protein
MLKVPPFRQISEKPLGFQWIGLIIPQYGPKMQAIIEANRLFLNFVREKS